MKLDREQDRTLLLTIIDNCHLQGKAAPVIADLMARVQAAGIEPELSKPKLVEATESKG